MKRIAVLLAACLLLCACAAGAGDENAVFIDPNAVQGGGYGALYFEANGVRFGIFDEAQKVIDALPAYRSSFVAETCAFDSKDVYYYYMGFQIMTNEIDGVERITAITLADDTVKTPQGLYIGMPESDAAAAFPALNEQNWNPVDGTAQLSVVIRDGAIAAIVYTPSN